MSFGILWNEFQPFGNEFLLILFDGLFIRRFWPFRYNLPAIDENIQIKGSLNDFFCPCHVTYAIKTLKTKEILSILVLGNEFHAFGKEF